jgi:hypothetical protein
MTIRYLKVVAGAARRQMVAAPAILIVAFRKFCA